MKTLWRRWLASLQLPPLARRPDRGFARDWKSMSGDWKRLTPWRDMRF